MTTPPNEQHLKDEIADLKSQLSKANALLNSPTSPRLPPHPLLLLTDSALPLGSFAFSSGLESYLAHHPTPKAHASTSPPLPYYLSLSLRSLASTTLPYLLAAHTHPTNLQTLDANLDATILCPVNKRASIAQGRALLTLWDRALRANAGPASPASRALTAFSAAMKASPPDHEDEEDDDDDGDSDIGLPKAHYPLIYAAVAAALGLTPHEAAYTYLFNHAKAVVSAGVRAGAAGPYAAQGVLGSGWLRGEIEGAMEREWSVGWEDAGQSVVMCDLWGGRHEVLYSRIFNS